MKANERERWLELGKVANHGDPFLCAFCRFFASWGDDDMQCEHPLPVVFGHNFEIALDGYDCWAFRPKQPWSKIASLMEKQYATQ